MRRLSPLLVALASLACAFTAQGQVPGAERIQSLTLDNGMTFIVWPDSDIPNVALYNWVRVGSRNEVPGITGLAHFFEHMMFNGTSTRPAGSFDQELEASGARNNASTSTDVTVYQDWLPRTSLELAFELESDRLRNLSFDPKVIESERGVVYSERRLSVEDNNLGRLMEQVQAAAFAAHPYGIPIIGWPSDIESWSIEDLKKFFATYYAPNNCTMILVGDVEPKQVFALARKYFESIPKQPMPEPVRTKEPQQQGERRVRIEAESQTPLIQIAYHSVASHDARVPVLQLLARILTDGDASRLRRALIEEQKLAISVENYFDPGFDPNLFWLFLSLPAQSDLARVEQAFDVEIERIRKEGVTAAELARARNQALADFWRGLSTINGKAEALGTHAVMRGDYKKLFDVPAEYESVTVDQIKQLANQLLRKKNRTVGVLAPAAKEAE